MLYDSLTKLSWKNKIAGPVRKLVPVLSPVCGK